ncbi:MAG: hypothetical protein KF729_10440 [Sandaracinaceae bacterium]|nr:hypothetical protein [Sandaracinaceae bacterium]
MEILALLGALVFIGLMMSSPLLIIGAAIYWARQERSKWDAVAASLGLRVAPSSRPLGPGIAFFGRPYFADELVGERAGFPVRIGTRVVAAGKSRYYYTYAAVDLPRPLELGLTLSPTPRFRGLLGPLFSSGAGLQVGDPTIDGSYTVQAAEPDLARGLLLVPYVAEALRVQAQLAFTPHVSDSEVRCEQDGKCFEPWLLARALDQAVDLARRLAAARQELGASDVERIVDTVWRGLAEARGFTLELAATRMYGRAEGVHVEVDTQLRGQRRCTVFAVRFDRPLGVGLSLTRQGGLAGLGRLVGLQDIQVGDPAFDQRFIVKGQPEAAVRALLTDEVRARLVELQSDASRLEVADDRIQAEVDWFVADPAHLASGIAAVARAGATLARVQAPPEIGPYRA